MSMRSSVYLTVHFRPSATPHHRRRGWDKQSECSKTVLSTHSNYTTTSTHKLHHNHHIDTQTTPQPPPRHTNHTKTTTPIHKLHHNHRLDTQTTPQPPPRHTNYTTTTVSTPRESIQPRAINYLLTYPLRPQWDIRPQQCFATRFCLLLRPGPHPRTAPSLSARPLLIVAMSSLAVLVSFFQVVSISVPLWGCCLGAFAEHALAILVVCV